MSRTETGRPRDGVASGTLDPDRRIGRVDPRLFGSFVEHMGRCVYTGIYEPDHPTAGEDGFRADVRDLARELGVTTVRYPGGNFVSSYRWEDGVGPLESRPVRLDLAWRALEPNHVGLNEFMGWVRGVGAEPMMAVNLGTRGVESAVDLIEYCNHPSGTYLSDLRRSHGARTPHGIHLWCLGNELDGPWQMGQKTASEYGRLAAETAKAMRMVDDTIELVAVGSSNSRMPTFGVWEAEVLEHTYELVDYISMHDYYELEGDDLGTFLASALDMDAFIGSVIATADHVGARLRSGKRLRISFDEWNVWYQSRFVGQRNLDWEFARDLIQDEYTVVDAVVVGSLLITLLRHADRVAIACQAQLVNVIAPIRTSPGGPAWRQTIFHPFAITAQLARGEALEVPVRTPAYETGRFGDVDGLAVVATWDEELGALAVFAANRLQDRVLPVEIDVRRLPELALARTYLVADDDLHAANTEAEPDRVRPGRVQSASLVDGCLSFELPAVSWAALSLVRPAPEGSDTGPPA
jgi:alpha-N-arabinofuranosidase